MIGVLAVGGEWVGSAEYQTLPDPMKGDAFMQVPLTSVEELKPFVESLQSVPKTGLHNPWKHPERYVELGHVSNKAGEFELGYLELGYVETQQSATSLPV